MDKKKLWNGAKIALKVVITGLLIWYVFQKIDVNKVKNLFLTSDVSFIVLAFVLYFASQLMSSWRLKTFLENIGLDLGYWFNFRLYLLGMFYNVFLPGGIGGDGYKIYLLRRKFKLPTKRLLLALFFDRLSGVWAIGFISVLLIIFIPKINIPMTWPITALLVGTSVYYFILRTFFKDYSRNFLISHFKSGMAQSLQVASVICILLGQGFTGKFAPYLFSFLLSSIIGIINVGIAGLGVKDVFMAHAADVFDISPDLAVLISLTFWLISVLAALPGVWFVYRSKEFEPMPDEDEVKREENDLNNPFESHLHMP
ncbi:lysylphosphatidylglycerol synthase transmembrane domain-containing protein [Arcticibacter sp. MXS-1]|uniref:lysylphosphatidylglycerol synthase transmembrane domain-containing protein n=1 Tax=Arcticibacter sp. MXS-1 TaxID=3341726 RepID=UPI0035A8B784